MQVDTDLQAEQARNPAWTWTGERAADMGVSVDAIARTMRDHAGWPGGDALQEDGEQYDVVVQTESSKQHARRHRQAVCARQNDTMIPLAALVKTREVVVPRDLNHFGQRRFGSTITVNLSPELALGDALKGDGRHCRAGDAVSYTTDLNGQSPRFRNSSGSLAVVFGLSLLFITWCWRHSLRASSTLHHRAQRAAVDGGGAVGAEVHRGTLNVFSQIGLSSRWWG